jgi:phage tail-like protein
MPDVRNDPYGNFNFLVEIDGVTKAAFTEVSGLDVEVDVIDYRTGGDTSLSVRKLPGLVKYSNIVLKRGITLDHSLWDWMKKVVEGVVQRTSMTIVLLDDQRQPVLRWKIKQAWPVKWTGPALNAKTSEVAIESLEITHEGLEFEPQ